ncbi:hypothetical protein EYC98_19820 [Halieaceae bacterium IMCC14734]|uniref:DUF4760 domain-containing protein n=1 Tax=Candidatus Litorirhabdus singularis TaxID=2518993 RepID=A0ABT3TN07_9GAMM|nr:hypothetical protein [Candidatus Litorirhabdus singularis]MCX2983116.1 hypothetical protein [Candidatus Litorirhabdus singularis]
MSIQELGSLGELIAAIATLATLIYLALQIRQNTNSVAGATELEINKEITAWHARITADPELMLLYEKGAQNEAMNESEALRYRWLVAELIWFYEGVYRQHNRGLISETQWETVVTSILGLLGADVLRTWWEAKTAALSEDFVSYIDERRSDGTVQRWTQRSVSTEPTEE